MQAVFLKLWNDKKLQKYFRGWDKNFKDARLRTATGSKHRSF